MKKQDIYNKTLFHLRKQGKAAVADGVCVYRSHLDGGMCAVGVHIPDHLYTPSIEYASISTLTGSYDLDVNNRSLLAVLRKIGFRKSQFPLLEALQTAHDSELQQEGLDAWESAMRDIASDFRLKYTPA